MNTRYHIIPTYRRQVLLTVGSLAVYLLFLFFAKATFSDVSVEMRRFWGQAGLVLVFTGALLAGLPFFWNTKAKKNTTTAQAVIDDTSATIELLEKLHKDMGGQFSGYSEYLDGQRKIAEEVLQKANNFPQVVDSLGAFSLILIGAGTICQMVSLG